MTELRLILAILASTGARLEPVLLTDGAGAALWGRSIRRCEEPHRLVRAPRCHSNQSSEVSKASVPHPVEADLSLSVAGGEVGLGLRCGALGADAVTHALMSTLRLLSALLVATLVRALGGATRTLAGAGGTERGGVKNRRTRTVFPMKPANVFGMKIEHPPAHFIRLQFALLVVGLVGVIATQVPTLITVPTVTLLSWLNQAVPTDGLARLWKQKGNLQLNY